MKKYTEPSTDVRNIELSQMIAATNLGKGEDVNSGEGDAKLSNFSDNSSSPVWSSDEEE